MRAIKKSVNYRETHLVCVRHYTEHDRHRVRDNKHLRRGNINFFTQNTRGNTIGNNRVEKGQQLWAGQTRLV